MSEPKILIWDIETLPNLQQALKYWTQLSSFPGKTMRATVNSICCIGWKWLGGSKTECIKAWDYSRWNRDVNDDFTVCREFLKVIKQADAIITQNGRRFDWKFLQTRLLHHDMELLHNIPHIDTKVISSSNLFMINNRLGTMGREWVNDDKLDNGGWNLWIDTYNKDPKALKLMETYCKQDVDLLEKVFIKLRPLTKNIPNYNRFSKERICTKCGSTNIVLNGWHHTQAMSYQRMFCKDCRSWSKLVGKNEEARKL